jgi:hypothetical protein
MEWSFELKCIETGLSYFFNVYHGPPKDCKSIKEEPIARIKTTRKSQVKHNYRLKSGELYPIFYSCVSFCILKFPFDRAHPLLTVVFLSD